MVSFLVEVLNISVSQIYGICNDYTYCDKLKTEISKLCNRINGKFASMHEYEGKCCWNSHEMFLNNVTNMKYVIFSKNQRYQVLYI